MKNAERIENGFLVQLTLGSKKREARIRRPVSDEAIVLAVRGHMNVAPSVQVVAESTSDYGGKIMVGGVVGDYFIVPGSERK